MKKIILILLAGFGIFCLVSATQITSHQQDLPDQEDNKATLSVATIKSLEARGFEVAEQYFPVRSPRMLDSTNLPETAHIKMSLDVRKAKNLQITWLGVPTTQKIAASQNDIILTEGFEEDFPVTNWRLSGAQSSHRHGWTSQQGIIRCRGTLERWPREFIFIV